VAELNGLEKAILLYKMELNALNHNVTWRQRAGIVESDRKLIS
jgi:hypothetical protein